MCVHFQEGNLEQFKNIKKESAKSKSNRRMTDVVSDPRLQTPAFAELPAFSVVREFDIKVGGGCPSSAAFVMRDTKISDHAIARGLHAAGVDLYMDLVPGSKMPIKELPKSMFWFKAEYNAFILRDLFDRGLYIDTDELTHVVDRTCLADRLKVIPQGNNAGRHSVRVLVQLEHKPTVLYRMTLFFITTLNHSQLVFSGTMEDKWTNVSFFDSLFVYHSCDVKGVIRETWELNGDMVLNLYIEPMRVTLACSMVPVMLQGSKTFMSTNNQKEEVIEKQMTNLCLDNNDDNVPASLDNDKYEIGDDDTKFKEQLRKYVSDNADRLRVSRETAVLKNRHYQTQETAAIGSRQISASYLDDFGNFNVDAADPFDTDELAEEEDDDDRQSCAFDPYVVDGRAFSFNPEHLDEEFASDQLGAGASASPSPAAYDRPYAHTLSFRTE